MEGIEMPAVTSKDGTTIAYDKTGHGPAVIHVAGSLGTRSFGFPDHARLLASHFTVYNYDRRGRGESTDTRAFAVEREVEDIEALINEAGGSAYLYGISSGACLVLEAAIMLESKVKKLALYEAPYNSDPDDSPIWHDYYTKLNKLVAANKRGDAVVHFMQFVGMPDNMIENMRSQPRPRRLRTHILYHVIGHTYELHEMHDGIAALISSDQFVQLCVVVVPDRLIVRVGIVRRFVHSQLFHF